MSGPETLGAVEAATAIRAGRLTSVALVEACLARIAAREAEVQAWAFLDPAAALTQARARDEEAARGAWRGPLHGLPVGVKDAIDVAGVPTGHGTPIWDGYRPLADAACVVALRAAGGLVLGKTVTTELANRHPARTRNPLALAHSPGGSSSGSAAAVADRMVPLALGAQTGGSLIRPAAYCGLVAWKPTYGSINATGVKPLSPSQDTVGVYARSVADAALFGSALIGVRPPDLEAALQGGAPRLALYRTPQWALAEPAMVAAFEGLAARLARAGARVTELAPPARFDAIVDAGGLVNDYETYRSLAWERVHHGHALSATLSAKLHAAASRTHAEYLAALDTARECRALLDDLLREVDAIVTPAAEGEAPRGLENVGKTAFHQMWTLLHAPSVAVPVFRGPQGLPMGVQVIARHGEDDRALAWAAWVARALG